MEKHNYNCNWFSFRHILAMFFILFLSMYMITLLGNMLLITAVRLNPQLQTPMYFFLTNLALIDICFSSTIVPLILVNTLSEDRRITWSGCASQMFISLALGATECLLLAVMAFDRYVAICKPLRYHVILNQRLCVSLITSCWMLCIINSLIHVNLTFRLSFCRTHQINHYFCEVPPLFQMSCSDTWFNEFIIHISALTLGMCSFLLTLVSYFRIICTIMQTHSSEGRHKTFSSCSSHLIVVSLYYGPIMVMYLRPHSAYSPETDKTISILYTVVTPMFNPIVYGIRNKPVIVEFLIKPLDTLQALADTLLTDYDLEVTSSLAIGQPVF
uniref:Olfactory receptor n=1 Tax=Leptobrachium leishanense TaxID=445787 RepID=A0A8C5QVM1_9ANUR